jgi:2-iminobutanoate/2-iminopropanoate deaminase
MDAQTASPLEVIHHEGYDPSINPMFVPAIRVGNLAFVSGLTAAPTYHAHPHVAEDFDSIPADTESQAKLLFANLQKVLDALGAKPNQIVRMDRFFTDVGNDQNAVNKVQGEALGGHLPTSTTVEVKRLATDPRLKLEINFVVALD